MPDGPSRWPLLQYDVIGQAWRLYKRHWVVWSAAVVIWHLATSSLGGSLGWYADAPRGHLHLVPVLGGSLVLMAIHALFLGGLIRMADNQINGRAPRLSDLLDLGGVWFDLVLGAVLVTILVGIGVSSCLIPGLIAAGLFLFTIPLVAVNRFTAVEAMTQSFTALKSQWLNATIFHMGLGMVAVSGVMLCGVGALVTLPLYPLSLAILNRRFFGGAVPAETMKTDDPFPEI